ncbi:MAG: HAD-IB family phosphatase [Deltaproteobacteria bacterium]|nr:HAD-IB family phosphatase [Deltaproteobacteria bacterium]
MRDIGKTFSFSAIGIDAPGLMSVITERIFEMGGNIIDVEENSRKGLFSIFLIIDFSASSFSPETLMDRLKDIEKVTKLRVMFRIYEEMDPARLPRKQNHLVTVLGVDRPGIIARISSFFLRYHINIETCRMIARGKFFSMEMTIDTMAMVETERTTRRKALSEMKAELKALCREMGQGVVIQSENIYKKMKKLVVFDVETTLLNDFSLKQFIDRVSGDAAYANGTLSRHVERLRGIPASELERFSESLQLNPGAFELIRILKSMGFKTALLSSGIDLFMKEVLRKAGVDYAFSNTLEVDEKGKMTGRMLEPIITDDTKEEILEFIRDAEGISRDQIIAVGDGSIRSHFIKNAGLSIAFKPEEKDFTTDGMLDGDQIIHLLYCLGIPRTEIERYIES